MGERVRQGLQPRAAGALKRTNTMSLRLVPLGESGQHMGVEKTQMTGQPGLVDRVLDVNLNAELKMEPRANVTRPSFGEP